MYMYMYMYDIQVIFPPSVLCSLALVDDHTLTIGSVDQIQMLHIHTIPLAESPL